MEVSRDRLDRDRPGRVVSQAQHDAAVRARVSVLLSVPPIWPGQASRPREEAGSPAKAPSREAVLKVVSWSKSARSPANQAQYIGRSRDSDRDAGRDPLPLENERGALIAGKASIAAEIDSWQLEPDEANLSPRARTLPPADRKQLPTNERLQYRQAVHLIYSIPRRSPSDPEKLRAAVRAGLSETFGAGGYRYVFAIHTDHGSRPHAHIIVKATAEKTLHGRRRAPRLRLGPDALQTLRHVLTRNAQQHGIEVIATRREDRAELRQRILEGGEPLRADRSWHQRKQTHQGRIFEKAAPAWYQEFGPAYECRRAMAAQAGATKAVEGPSSPQRPSLVRRLLGLISLSHGPRVQGRSGGYVENFANVRAGRAAKAATDRGEHPSLAALSGYFARTHIESETARDAFLALYREAPKLALWASTNHPVAFGETNGATPPRLDVQILRDLPLNDQPARDTWTEEHGQTKRKIDEFRLVTMRARQEHVIDSSRRAVRHSIEGVARQAATAIKHDLVEARDSSARLEQLADAVSAVGAEMRSQEGRAARLRGLAEPKRMFNRGTPRSRPRSKGIEPER